MIRRHTARRPWNARRSGSRLRCSQLVRRLCLVSQPAALPPIRRSSESVSRWLSRRTGMHPITACPRWSRSLAACVPACCHPPAEPATARATEGKPGADGLSLGCRLARNGQSVTAAFPYGANSVDSERPGEIGYRFTAMSQVGRTVCGSLTCTSRFLTGRSVDRFVRWPLGAPFLSLLLAAVPPAEAAGRLFSDTGSSFGEWPAEAEEMVRGGAELRLRRAEIDIELLHAARAAYLADPRTGGSLELNLFEDATFTASALSSAPTASGFVLSGSLDEVPFGTVTLVVNGRRAGRHRPCAAGNVHDRVERNRPDPNQAGRSFRSSAARGSVARGPAEGHAGSPRSARRSDRRRGR